MSNTVMTEVDSIYCYFKASLIVTGGVYHFDPTIYMFNLLDQKREIYSFYIFSQEWVMEIEVEIVGNINSINQFHY